MIRFIGKYVMVLHAGAVLLWIRLMLRTKSLSLVLDTLTAPALNRTSDATILDDWVYYVDRWLQIFPYNAKGNCFPRSLALYWRARRCGYPVYFHCGVKKEGTKLDGHAWLTLERKPFCEMSQQWQRFTVTFSYPAEPPAARLASNNRA